MTLVAVYDLVLVFFILLVQLVFVVYLQVLSCALRFFHFFLNFEQVLFEFVNKLSDCFLVRSLDILDTLFIGLLQL